MNKGGHYLSKPCGPNDTSDRTLRNDLFEFKEVELYVTDDAVVKYGAQPGSHKVMRFTVRDRVNYARGMTEATAGLLASLGKLSSAPEERPASAAPPK